MIKQQRLVIATNAGLMGDLFAQTFRAEGYLVERCSLMEAKSKDSFNIGLVCTDRLSQSLLDFLEVLCTRARKTGSHIILVTRDDGEKTVVPALAVGVDDVFGASARLATILQRVRYFTELRLGATVTPNLKYADIRFNSETAVERGGRMVRLSPIEARVLKYFLLNLQRVVSRSELLDNVWGQNNAVEQRSVDVTIGRLRRALSVPGQMDPIRSVRGRGYIFGYDASGNGAELLAAAQTDPCG